MLNLNKYPMENKAFINPFKFYSDAGHGWLAVPIDILKWLGIFGEVTAYSYFDSTNVYLEEDADYALFDKAMKSKGLSYSIEDVDHGDRSPIRNKKRCI
jgi:hypothetical protein